MGSGVFFIGQLQKRLLTPLIVCVLVSGQTWAQVRGLSHAEALARAYDAILDSRFDQARAELHRACEPTTIAACQTMIAASEWWEIQLDPANQARDGQFLRDTEHAIEAAEAWKTWNHHELKRRSSWEARTPRAANGECCAANRLPPLVTESGSRPHWSKPSQLMRGEADFQLHLVYLWYERQPRRAIQLLDGLRGRYPHNPVFPQRIAEIQSEYLQDHETSLITWRALADAAQAGQVAAAPLALTSARLGMAQQLNALSQPSRAIDVLKSIVAVRPTQPYSALALSYFQLGGAYERLGQRQSARTAYQNAFDAAPHDDPYRIRTRARRAITDLQRPERK